MYHIPEDSAAEEVIESSTTTTGEDVGTAVVERPEATRKTISTTRTTTI